LGTLRETLEESSEDTFTHANHLSYIEPPILSRSFSQTAGHHVVRSAEGVKTADAALGNSPSLLMEFREMVGVRLAVIGDGDEGGG
jgi:hypothetical protein